jgi:hypothetical protein
MIPHRALLDISASADPHPYLPADRTGWLARAEVEPITPSAMNDSSAAHR